MGLGFFLHYPETTCTESDMLDVGPLRDVAIAAERAGFTGISLTEHPIPGARWLEAGGHQSLDPLVGLGYVAGATDRLKLLTNLVVAPPGAVSRFPAGRVGPAPIGRPWSRRSRR